MKDSIANVWLLGLVITFILLFSAYIAITVDYSQTFKLKNEVLNIIEKNKGMTSSTGQPQTSKIKSGKSITVDVGALQTINLYLAGNAYTAKGPCPENDGAKWYGVKALVYDSTSSIWEDAQKGTDYYYCFAKFRTGQANIKYNSKSGKESSIYYKVRLFYKMEFPVLQDFFEVKVEGVTDEIYRPLDDSFGTSALSNYFN